MQLSHEEYQSIQARQKEALDEFLKDPTNQVAERKMLKINTALTRVIVGRGIECQGCTAGQSLPH